MKAYENTPYIGGEHACVYPERRATAPSPNSDRLRKKVVLVFCPNVYRHHQQHPMWSDIAPSRIHVIFLAKMSHTTHNTHSPVNCDILMGRHFLKASQSTNNRLPTPKHTTHTPIHRETQTYRTTRYTFYALTPCGGKSKQMPCIF